MFLEFFGFFEKLSANASRILAVAAIWRLYSLPNVNEVMEKVGSFYLKPAIEQDALLPEVAINSRFHFVEKIRR
ncbi:MAG: hypothetical protein EOO46_11960 [Flavobacterium sp.]|nr:MAG: hypothetical protein EOO46_11960 [Flavobacterium sp.]